MSLGDDGGVELIVNAPRAGKSLRLHAAISACAEAGLEVLRASALPKPARRDFWTDRRVAVLKRLWLEEELSAAECAAKLGCTSNAVIGKAHREGWVRDQGAWGRNVRRAHDRRRAARRAGWGDR